MAKRKATRGSAAKACACSKKQPRVSQRVFEGPLGAPFTAAPSIERLPTELHCFIIFFLAREKDHASRRNLANLRLASRRLNPFATACLFEEIPLWLSLRSLDNLVKISEHSIIASCVRCVVFSPLSFNPIKPGEEETVKAMIERQAHSLNERDIHYAHYQLAIANYRNESVYLDSMASIVMVRAFRRLDALDKVRIRSGDTWIGAREIRQRLFHLSGYELSFESKTTMSILMNAFKMAEKRLRKFELIGLDGLQEGSLERLPFHLNQHSARYRPLPVKELLAFPRISSDGLKNAIRVHPFAEVFNPLDSIEELFLTGVYSSLPDRAGAKRDSYRVLRRLVANRCNLRKLTLRALIDLSYCRFEKVFKPNQIFMLEYINLTMFKFASASVFEDVFIKNAQTLKRCYLREVRAKEQDDWPAILRNLSKADFTSLEVFSTTDCVISHHSTDFADFITRRTSRYEIIDDAIETYYSDDEDTVQFSEDEEDAEDS